MKIRAKTIKPIAVAAMRIDTLMASLQENSTPMSQAPRYPICLTEDQTDAQRLLLLLLISNHLTRHTQFPYRCIFVEHGVSSVPRPA
jgi:hypothetical protein